LLKTKLIPPRKRAESEQNQKASSYGKMKEESQKKIPKERANLFKDSTRARSKGCKTDPEKRKKGGWHWKKKS